MDNKKATALKKLDARDAEVIAVNLRNMTELSAPQLEDTLDDLFAAISIIEEPLSDGIQWLEDLLEIVRSRKYIEEIINDYPLLANEFTAVVIRNPQLALKAVQNAYHKAQATHELGKVATFVARQLFTLTSSAAAAYDQVELWQSFLAGEQVIPAALDTGS